MPSLRKLIEIVFVLCLLSALALAHGLNTATLVQVRQDDPGGNSSSGALSGSFFTNDSALSAESAGGGAEQPAGGVLYASTFPGTDWIAKLDAAIASVPPAGGVVSLEGFPCPQTSATGDYVLKASNVTVRFGACTYSLNGNFKITGKNVALLCAAPGICTLSMVDDRSAAGKKLWISLASNVIIDGLVVTQSNVKGRTAVYGNIFDDGSANVTLRNLEVTSGSSVGIFSGSNFTGGVLTQAVGLRVENVYIHDVMADGLHMSRGTIDIVVNGLTVKNTGDDCVAFMSLISDDGVHMYPSVSNAVFSNSVIKNCGSHGITGRGIAVNGAHDITISNVSVDSPADAGVIVAGQPGNIVGTATYYPYHDSLSGITITNSGAGGASKMSCGVYIGYARDIVVSGSTIRKTTHGTGSADGICVLHVAKDIHLIGVNVSEPAGNGIMVAQEASTEARLRKELWTDLGDSAPPAVGISDVMIGSPNLRNVGLNGIFVQGGTPHAFHVNVSNPNIYGIPARRYAISYAMVDDSTISGGTIVSVNSGPTGGVKASAGAGITVSGVNLSTSYDGVDLVACTGCLVISNIIAGSNGNFGVYVDPTGKGNSVSGNSITGTFAGDRIRSQDSTSLVGSNPGADRK